MSVKDMAELGLLFEAHWPRLIEIARGLLDSSLGVGIDPEELITDPPWILKQLHELADKNNEHKPAIRLAALKLMGDHLGTWTPKTDPPPIPIDITKWTDDEKRVLLKAFRRD